MALQQLRTAGVGELLADLLAVGTTGASLGYEIRSCLVDVRLDLLGADPQQSTDLALAQAVHLCEDECGSLVLW